MDGELPLGDEVYVLKEGRRLGPFTVEDLLDGLESGDFSEDDVCLRAGAGDCERLRDLLDWDEGDGADDEAGQDDEEDEELEEAEEEEWEEPPPPRRETPRPAGSGAAGGADRILYVGHPSVLTYPFAILALVGGVTGGIWLYRIDPIFTLAGLGLATAGLARLSFVRFTHDYRIRLRRIEVVTGFLARSSREVRITDVRSINVTCRGLAGMFGIGTVDFLTSGDEPEVSFERIWAARRIKALVRRLQDSA